MKNLVLKATALAKGIERLGIDFQNEIDKNVSKVNQIKTREVEASQGLSQSVTSIKRKFGDLFYGSLCPINGVGPKNRRYFNKSWKTPDNYEDARALQGPVVWKKIGEQRNYSTRVNWCDSAQVFDTLKSEHIDLVINGLRNRKDQRQVAKDLFSLKEEIQLSLENAGAMEKNCILSKPYECQLVLVDEKFNNIQLPSDIVPSICKEVLINGEKLTFYFDLSTKVIDHLKDRWDIDVNSNNYYYGSNINCQKTDTADLTLNILEKADGETFHGEFSYHKYFIPIGLYKAYSDPAIDKFFNESVSKKRDAIDLIEDAQSKYAPRLLMKGAF